MSQKSPLEFLETHFAALESRLVEIEGLPFALRFAPMNAEQAFKYVAAAKAPSAGQQARLFAEVLVEVARLEDGQQAFPLVKGGPNPVEVLTKKTPPSIFAELVRALSLDAIAGEAEDVEKKSA